MSGERPEPQSQPEPRSLSELRRTYSKDAEGIFGDVVDVQAAHDYAVRAAVKSLAQNAAVAALEPQQQNNSALALRNSAPVTQPEQGPGRQHRRKLIVGIALASLAIGGGVWYQANKGTVSATATAPSNVSEAIMENMADIDAAGMDALGPQSCSEPGAEIATVVLTSVRVPLIYKVEPASESGTDWTFVILDQEDEASEVKVGYVGDTPTNYPEVQISNMVMGITACEKEDTPEPAVKKTGDRVEVNLSDIDFQAELFAYKFTNSADQVGDEPIVVYPAGTGIPKKPEAYTNESVDKANKLHDKLIAADPDNDIKEHIPDQLYGAVNLAARTVITEMMDVNNGGGTDNVRLPDGMGSFPEALRSGLAMRVSDSGTKPAKVDMIGTLTEVKPLLSDHELQGIVPDPSVLLLTSKIPTLVQVDEVAAISGAYNPEGTERP